MLPVGMPAHAVGLLSIAGPGLRHVPCLGVLQQRLSQTWHSRGSSQHPAVQQRAFTVFPEEEDKLGRPTTPWVRQVISGVDLMRHPKYNKGLAFSEAERDRLYLRGLLPPAVLSQEVQLERAILNLRSKEDPLDKYTYLSSLQGRNERLFYRWALRMAADSNAKYSSSGANNQPQQVPASCWGQVCTCSTAVATTRPVDLTSALQHN
jgi:hypothetical protein